MPPKMQPPSYGPPQVASMPPTLHPQPFGTPQAAGMPPVKQGHPPAVPHVAGMPPLPLGQPYAALQSEALHSPRGRAASVVGSPVVPGPGHLPLPLSARGPGGGNLLLPKPSRSQEAPLNADVALSAGTSAAVSLAPPTSGPAALHRPHSGAIPMPGGSLATGAAMRIFSHGANVVASHLPREAAGNSSTVPAMHGSTQLTMPIAMGTPHTAEFGGAADRSSRRTNIAQRTASNSPGPSVSPPRSPRIYQNSNDGARGRHGSPKQESRRHDGRCYEGLYADAAARKERLRSLKELAERAQDQEEQLRQLEFARGMRERRRLYRTMDRRTHLEREEEVLRKREETMKEKREAAQRAREEEELRECTFRPSPVKKYVCRPGSLSAVASGYLPTVPDRGEAERARSPTDYHCYRGASQRGRWGGGPLPGRMPESVAVCVDNGHERDSLAPAAPVCSPVEQVYVKHQLEEAMSTTGAGFEAASSRESCGSLAGSADFGTDAASRTLAAQPPQQPAPALAAAPAAVVATLAGGRGTPRCTTPRSHTLHNIFAPLECNVGSVISVGPPPATSAPSSPARRVAVGFEMGASPRSATSVASTPAAGSPTSLTATRGVVVSSDTSPIHGSKLAFGDNAGDYSPRKSDGSPRGSLVHYPATMPHVPLAAAFGHHMALGGLPIHARGPGHGPWSGLP